MLCGFFWKSVLREGKRQNVCDTSTILSSSIHTLPSSPSSTCGPPRLAKLQCHTQQAPPNRPLQTLPPPNAAASLTAAAPRACCRARGACPPRRAARSCLLFCRGVMTASRQRGDGGQQERQENGCVRGLSGWPNSRCTAQNQTSAHSKTHNTRTAAPRPAPIRGHCCYRDFCAPPSDGSQRRLTAFLKVIAAMWRTPRSTLGSAATRSRLATWPRSPSCCWCCFGRGDQHSIRHIELAVASERVRLAFSAIAALLLLAAAVARPPSRRAASSSARPTRTCCKSASAALRWFSSWLSAPCSTPHSAGMSIFVVSSAAGRRDQSDHNGVSSARRVRQSSIQINY